MEPIVDHIQITVQDLAAAEAFYDQLMPLLGFYSTFLMIVGGGLLCWIGLGIPPLLESKPLRLRMIFKAIFRDEPAPRHSSTLSRHG